MQEPDSYSKTIIHFRAGEPVGAGAAWKKKQGAAAGATWKKKSGAGAGKN